MKKIVSCFFAVLFIGSLLTSCMSAQADEIYENVVPEKSTDGNVENTGHRTGGPTGG